MNIVAQLRNQISSPTGPLPAGLPKLVALGGLSIATLMFCGRSHKESSKEHQLISPNSTPASISEISALRNALNQKFEELRRKDELLNKINKQLGTPAETNPEFSTRKYTSAPAPVAPAIDEKRQEQEERRASNISFSYRPTPQVSGAVNPVTDNKQSVRSTEGEPLKTSKMSYRVREGSMVEAVLKNRLDGTFSGPVECMVTAPVYSEDGQVLLIPRGTEVLGRVEKVGTQGQQRLALFFHRMILPDGSSFSLKETPGLNGVGETGLRGRVNHHYGQLFGVSAALGIIGGVAASQTNYGPYAGGEDRYLQGGISSATNLSTQILNRQLAILPTVTIQEGERVMVYMTQDLHFPAYSGRLVEDSNDPVQN